MSSLAVRTSEPTIATPTPARTIIYLGMEVHKDSITIAVLPGPAKTPTRLERLPNDLPKLKQWFDRVAKQGELRACYEASGAGDVLHRAMREWGVRVRGDRALNDPDTTRGATQARHVRRDRSRALLSRRRARRGAHPERGRGTGA